MTGANLTTGALVIVATSTANKPLTFLTLFVGQILSWAGVPALGAATSAATGALASQGVIQLWAVVVVGTIGAEIGSLIGWYIGFRTARAGLDEQHRDASKRQKAIDAGEKLARRWGPLLVLFVPSWVSGAVGMRFRRFAAWNLLAACLWNIGASLSAYGIGAAISQQSLPHALIPLLIGLLCLAMIVVLLRHVRQRHRHHREHVAEPVP